MEVQVQNKVIVSVNGDDTIIAYEELGLNFDSSESEVLETLRPIIQERHGIDLSGSHGWLFKTRKAMSSQNIHVIPNSTAGFCPG